VIPLCYCFIVSDLDLQSCSQLHSVDLMLIGKLYHLKRLNLYRMRFDKKFLDALGKYVTCFAQYHDMYICIILIAILHLEDRDPYNIIVYSKPDLQKWQG